MFGEQVEEGIGATRDGRSGTGRVVSKAIYRRSSCQFESSTGHCGSQETGQQVLQTYVRVEEAAEKYMGR